MISLSISLRAVETLHCGFYPCSESLLCCRNFSLWVSGSQLRWWDFPTRKQSRIQPAAWISPTQRPKVCRYRLWIENNTTGLSNHFQDKPTIPL